MDISSTLLCHKAVSQKRTNYNKQNKISQAFRAYFLKTNIIRRFIPFFGIFFVAAPTKSGEIKRAASPFSAPKECECAGAERFAPRRRPD